MLRSLHTIMRSHIEATDKEFGRVNDFLFDDATWTVRYMVADTGNWLPGRLVLISPDAIGKADWPNGKVSVSLTTAQIEASPPINAHEPVSRQHETALALHYEWEPYWSPVGPWGVTPTMVRDGEKAKEAAEEAVQAQQGDPHLRSVHEVTGYAVEATNGEIGKVADFIANTKDWAIRYLVVKTGGWFHGRKVLVAPDWVKDVRWPEHEVTFGHTRDEVKGSPEFDPEAPLDRDYEAKLHDHYGRPGYWDRP